MTRIGVRLLRMLAVDMRRLRPDVDASGQFDPLLGEKLLFFPLAAIEEQVAEASQVMSRGVNAEGGLTGRPFLSLHTDGIRQVVVQESIQLATADLFRRFAADGNVAVAIAVHLPRFSERRPDRFGALPILEANGRCHRETMAQRHTGVMLLVFGKVIGNSDVEGAELAVDHRTQYRGGHGLGCRPDMQGRLVRCLRALPDESAMANQHGMIEVTAQAKIRLEAGDGLLHQGGIDALFRWPHDLPFTVRENHVGGGSVGQRTPDGAQPGKSKGQAGSSFQKPTSRRHGRPTFSEGPRHRGRGGVGTAATAAAVPRKR